MSKFPGPFPSTFLWGRMDWGDLDLSWGKWTWGGWTLVGGMDWGIDFKCGGMDVALRILKSVRELRKTKYNAK